MKISSFSICHFVALLLIFLAIIPSIALGAPSSSTIQTGSDAKSAFGQPFDEIVVESTLNVKRKPNSRQNRTKRQQSFATAQAQSHQFSQKFGASASGSQSQSLIFGPKGPMAVANFAGSQQYKLPNGQVLRVAFGNAASNFGFEQEQDGPAT